MTVELAADYVGISLQKVRMIDVISQRPLPFRNVTVDEMKHFKPKVACFHSCAGKSNGDTLDVILLHFILFLPIEAQDNRHMMMNL